MMSFLRLVAGFRSRNSLPTLLKSRRFCLPCCFHSCVSSLSSLSYSTISNVCFNYASSLNGAPIAHFHRRYSTLDFSSKRRNNSTMASKVAMPQDVLFQPRLSIEDIKTETKKLMKDAKGIYDKIAAVPTDNTQELAKVIDTLAALDAEYGSRRCSLDLPRYVSDDAALREASVEADKELSNFDVEMSLRKDVFKVITAIEGNKEIMDKADAETKRFIQRMVINGKRNGLHLPDDKLERVKKLKQRMSELCIEFEQNISDSIKTLTFKAEELDGVPEDFLSSLEKDGDGKLKVELSYPHYFPIMKKARRPETRLRLESEFNSRGKEKNVAILNEVLKIRLELAHIFGYKTHAAYALELRMAKNPETVSKFLKDLAEKLKPYQQLDHALYLKYKRELCDELKIPFENKLTVSDWRYFANLAEERLFSIDHEKYREYFEVGTVVSKTLQLYERIFGLEFKPLCNKKELPAWHDDVRTFAAYDADSKKLLSYIYLDLYPRPGKFTHACCIPLQSGCEKVGSNGAKQPGVTVVLANFTKPDPNNNKPSLLTHDEVETFLHEFGHAVHNVCGVTKYEFFSGTRVENDFVEAPSQMLEHWAWQPESLTLLSKHYKTGEPLNTDMMKALNRARHANAGVTLMRQVLLASFDQAIHVAQNEGDLPKDIAALYADLATKISGIEATPGTCMPASFGHLTGGYDAQYYGYLWSEVYSFDMFDTRFVPAGILDGKIGREYRRCILEPGGSKDAADMLKMFLGRDPQSDAFLKARQETYGGEPYSTLKP